MAILPHEVMGFTPMDKRLFYDTAFGLAIVAAALFVLICAVSAAVKARTVERFRKTVRDANQEFQRQGSSEQP